MEKTGDEGRGTMLLATVKGDVHDIGKNLVDIILSNNGYRVVNIGIKQTINQIIDAAQESNVDAIGMSGLLVKSTGHIYMSHRRTCGGHKLNRGLLPFAALQYGQEA